MQKITTIENMDKEIKSHKLEELTNIVALKLQEFNKCNSLSEDYIKAIRITLFYMMFYTNKEKIIAIPLKTGGGKSTMTELTMAYMYNDSLLRKYCGTIILKLTKEDCDTTAENINKYANKDIAYAYHTGNVESNENGLIIKAKSNEIDDENLQLYPILVMTHEGYKQAILRETPEDIIQPKNKKRKKGKTTTDVMIWTDKSIDNISVNYNSFYRDRLIIDEEISNVEPVTVNLQMINELENYIMNLGNEKIHSLFTSFIKDIKNYFIKPYEDLKANQLYFVTFENIKPSQDLNEILYGSGRKMKEIYINILNLIAHGGYVKYSEDINFKSITTYKYINISHPLFKKIQLDATADTNALYKYNDYYRILDLPDIKTYNNTYLHIYDKITGSRASIKEHFENGMLNACLKDIEHKLSKNETALVIFNNKNIEIEFREMIKDLSIKKRLFLTHFGRTTGSNKWKDCDKLFVIGINVLPDPVYPIFYFCNSGEENFNEYDTALRPQKGSRVYMEQRFEDVRSSMVASSMIQALNRIKIRKYIDGDTPETHIYLINSDKKVDNIISNGMKGIQIQYDWDLQYSPPIKEYINKVESNAKRVIQLIMDIIDNKESVYVQNLRKNKHITDKGVSKKWLREKLEFNNRPTFNKALSDPMFLQFCDDYNIDISDKNSYYIKI